MEANGPASPVSEGHLPSGPVAVDGSGSQRPASAVPDGRLPIRAKIGWGAGGACEGIMAGGLQTLQNPILVIALRMDPMALGWISAAPRFLDAAYDIWLGHLSDNAATRWGRRRPFIFGGAIAAAVTFAAVWWVPLTWSSHAQLAFFGVVSTAYWLSYSTFAIPYAALGFELTTDFNERTSVQAYRYFAIQCCTFALAGMWKLCFTWPFAGTGAGGVPAEVIGARWVTAAIAVLVLATGLAPALFAREPVATDRPAGVDLLTTLRLTFTDTLFLHFMTMNIVSITGVTVAGGLGLYVIVYHVFAGDTRAAADLTFVATSVVTALSLVAALALPGVARRIGKRGTILLGQALLIASGGTAWKLYAPHHPYWLIVPMMLATAGMACFQVLYGSFLGDICDVDELRSGTRREGMYGAAATFLNKLVYASTAGVAGAILGWVGYSPKDAVPSAHTVWLMRVVFSAAPAAFAVVGVGLALALPITAARLADVHRRLAERRSDAGLAVA